MRVSDEIYQCIHAVELKLRQHLQFCSPDKDVSKIALVDAMSKDPDVQFHWSLVTTELTEDAANDLYY